MPHGKGRVAWLCDAHRDPVKASSPAIPGANPAARYAHDTNWSEPVTWHYKYRDHKHRPRADDEEAARLRRAKQVEKDLLGKYKEEVKSLQ